MKTIVVLVSLFCILLCNASTGYSQPLIALAYWAFNIDGIIIEAPGEHSPPDPNQLPDYIDDSQFDWSTSFLDPGGLGALTIKFSPNAAGDYFVGAFFDHEIDEPINSLFNETGSTEGTPDAQLTWEIDEPGFVDGDIFYFNFLVGILDNSIGASIWGDTIFPDDVSIAMGWQFNFDSADDMAIIRMILSTQMPASGFYLAHTDPDSDISIYTSTAINSQQPIPEPGTLTLTLIGLMGLVGVCRKKLFVERE